MGLIRHSAVNYEMTRATYRAVFAAPKAAYREVMQLQKRTQSIVNRCIPTAFRDGGGSTPNPLPTRNHGQQRFG
jgi:hypothetical protein